MKQTLHLTSGISVLFTTLGFSHLMVGRISHDITAHGEGFSHPFFAVHTILIAAAGVLSLIGAYFLLTGWRRQTSN